MALRLPPLPALGDLIRLYGISAKSQLSQNFLLNLKITDKIARTTGSLEGCTVIEIGAGPGSLTRSLLKEGAKRVIAVEKDARFLPALEILKQASQGALDVVHGDMLRIDEEELLDSYHPDKGTVKMMGNLPFNVGTDLMLKWLRLIEKKRGPFAYGQVPMVLMFQKEVAERIVAPQGTKNYTRLSVMVQRLCEARIAFNLDGKSFVPAPDVDTSVVVLEPLETRRGDRVSTETLEFVLRKIFSQRRKKLKNSIVSAFGSEAEGILQAADIDSSLRPQELSIEEWTRIARQYDLSRGVDENEVSDLD